MSSSGPRTAGFAGDVGAFGEKSERGEAGAGALQEQVVMKHRVGWLVLAGAMMAAGAAGAQVLPPYDIGSPGVVVASDFDGPYAAMPPEMPLPPRFEGPRYGAPRYAPSLLPSVEVYTVLRENGYSPLGAPQQRGFVYTISVINPDGDDGRLVIDARTGRILRFMPAYRMGDRMGEEVVVSYGPAGPLPPIADPMRPPRPPLALPRVASRSPAVPLPKPMPRAVAKPPKAVAAKPVAPQLAPTQQTAVTATNPADAQAALPAAVPDAPPPVIEAKPSTPTVQPTQDMPAVQGLE